MVQNQKHTPVLLNETLQYLDPKPMHSYLDLTAGYGGHAAAVLNITHGPAILVDQDPDAAKHLKISFKDPSVTVLNQDFLSASQKFASEGRQFDIILADLGVSSPHLNTASRGFAINLDAPLDMRMNTSQGLSAQDIVNNTGQDELAEIIANYGQEPKARKIASLIVSNRPIRTTSELAKVVTKARRGNKPAKKRIHPATRTFQAIRIAVNDELEQLEKAMPIWIDLLKPSGRLVVISFHSLEDRIVKQALADASGKGYDARLKLLVKGPVTAGHDEIVSNPRARSAKLRAAAKINTERGEENAYTG